MDGNYRQIAIYLVFSLILRAFLFFILFLHMCHLIVFASMLIIYHFPFYSLWCAYNENELMLCECINVTL